MSRISSVPTKFFSVAIGSGIFFRSTRPSTRWLRLFRPATLDLILTKMMRGDDPQDMEDIAFLIRHDRITPAQIETAFKDAVIPNVTELHDAFERAKPLVREIANLGA